MVVLELAVAVGLRVIDVKVCLMLIGGREGTGARDVVGFDAVEGGVARCCAGFCHTLHPAIRHSRSLWGCSGSFIAKEVTNIS